MRAPSPLPVAGSGPVFLTEGGSETEIMYRRGFELPEFAMFPLLDIPSAVTAMRDMFRAQLDVAAEFGLGFLLSGLDYRASPDWGAKLGYSATALADANIAAIGFLREIAGDYRDQIPSLLIGGILGPRGDAYGLNRDITAESAEAYHAVQLETLKRTQVDFTCAMTFNNIPEAVGAARAAARIGVPLSVALTLDRTHRLKSGPTLGEAIAEIDAQTGLDAPDYYLVNCSHPLEYEPALDDGAWTRRLRGVRPNASKMEKMELCKLNHLEDGHPVELATQLSNLHARYPHMDVFGGCCGTGDKHLREIAKSLRPRLSRGRKTA
ncbi:homocysteine S-methyltransferase family protein [Chelativorans xinjiangense]|uniref:homocysteine S-methyltransferase family protein n=1 Tax=Chelativorans xinjiangense TaxID=2681485 RepID=UPI00135BF1EC|nr:homocysteine S-methyltransferase family protein [Chelativorans xinjiangense]